MGKPTQGELVRPIQTLIWYPAEQSAAAHLTYGDYLKLAATTEDFQPSQEKAARTIALAKKQWDVPPLAATWAMADARPQSGKFPVIIYRRVGTP